MDKNNLIDFITKLSQAAVSLPQKGQDETKSQTSFNEQTKNDDNKSQPQVTVQKVNRAKRSAPSTDAIIETIRAHNALSQSIISKTQKTGD